MGLRVDISLVDWKVGLGFRLYTCNMLECCGEQDGTTRLVRSTCSILVASSCFQLLRSELESYNTSIIPGRQPRLQYLANKVVFIFCSKVIHKNSPTSLPPRAYWDQPLCLCDADGTWLPTFSCTITGKISSSSKMSDARAADLGSNDGGSKDLRC